jgi:hypothetical protein
MRTWGSILYPLSLIPDPESLIPESRILESRILESLMPESRILESLILESRILESLTLESRILNRVVEPPTLEFPSGSLNPPARVPNSRIQGFGDFSDS